MRTTEVACEDPPCAPTLHNDGYAIRAAPRERKAARQVSRNGGKFPWRNHNVHEYLWRRKNALVPTV